MVRYATLFIGVAFGALLACGPGSAQKTLVVQCDPKAPGSECADSSAASKPPKKDPSDTASGASFAPNPQPTQPASDTNDKNPNPDLPEELGLKLRPECKGLQPCCDALRKAGFTGSANVCDRTVTDNVQSACKTMHEENKKPTDESDFVCE